MPPKRKIEGKSNDGKKHKVMCEECGSTFTQRSDLLRHKRTVHKKQAATCPRCRAEFSRMDALHRHIRRQHNGNPVSKPGNADRDNLSVNNEASLDRCNWCSQTRTLLAGKPFCESCANKGKECSKCHRPLPEQYFNHSNSQCDACVTKNENQAKRRDEESSAGLRSQRESAFDGDLVKETFSPTETNKWDLLQFFRDSEMSIQGKIFHYLKERKGIKWYLNVKVRFVKVNGEGENVTTDANFRSLAVRLTNEPELDEQLSEAFQLMYKSFDQFQREGSGWVLDDILLCELHVATYQAINGSSYIPLPKKLVDKKAVLNIQNNDDLCFCYCVLAHFHHVSRDNNANLASHYRPLLHELNLEGIDFPVPLSQIRKFERQNKISVNVFGYEQETVIPLHITKEHFERHVNLLLISSGEKQHYCLIRNLSRLLGDRTKHNGQSYYCNFCLHSFTTEILLNEHTPYCSPHGPQKIEMPDENDMWIKFKNIHKQLKVPFTIYADFESFTQNAEDGDQNAGSHTKAYQKHVPSGFSYIVISSNPALSKEAVTYRGPDVIQKFLECLLDEEKEISNILSNSSTLVMTPADEEAFQTAHDCHICNQPLGSDRVRDHDHLLSNCKSNYRGAAHNACNLAWQFRKSRKTEGEKTTQYFIPVVIHNLRGYDSHLIMKAIDQSVKKRIYCLPNNDQKYISFNIGNLRFIDSLQFLNASLENLVENMKADVGDDDDNFQILKKHFPDKNQRDLLLRKGVFPYSWLKTPEQFDDKYLPQKECFFNDLRQEEITDQEYEHAQTVYTTFHMNNMGEYHDMYLKSDTLLLACVFENFRRVSLHFYGLDPCHYVSSPGLAWDSMLKMSGVELQLLDDVDMYLMLERGIRGGISVVSKKYAKANNTYLPDTYCQNQPSNHIILMDMNNLYGYAMQEKMPEREFTWMTHDEIKNFDVMKVSHDSDTGYILEVDLEYPSELHDAHNNFPLAPEVLTVTDDMLSSKSRNLKEKLGIKGKPVPKLVPNLQHKKNYVVHYKNLQLYLRLGMKLSKIHRIIEFKQSAYLKNFIDFNTEQRKLARTEFQKDFFKLLNNSVFGRSMMNVRKHTHVELVNNAKRLKKIVAKSTFKSFKIFNESFAAVNLRTAILKLNQPIYTGFSILDISKTFMFSFHYDFMTPNYGEKAHILFTDTDSFCYEVQTDDIYADMRDHLNVYDTSNYPTDHPLFSDGNKKVLGKMKDEMASVPIEEFCGLKPKLYSIKCKGHDKKTAKGIIKSSIKKQLKHEMYKACLFSEKTEKCRMNLIRSFDHQLYTVAVDKIALSPYDDKRYVLTDGITTLAHGHYCISEEENISK